MHGFVVAVDFGWIYNNVVIFFEKLVLQSDNGQIQLWQNVSNTQYEIDSNPEESNHSSVKLDMSQVSLNNGSAWLSQVEFIWGQVRVLGLTDNQIKLKLKSV